jgi:hypothetical protein
VVYHYRSSRSGAFLPYNGDASDVDEVTIGGRSVPFVVRQEMGTINRHVFVIAVLAGSSDSADRPHLEHWNGKLVYQFRGGVGIGRRQGVARPTLIPERRESELAQGYAVAYSTANQTSTQYDIELQEDTVARVKRQFVARYGEPEFTIGIGGSGGAIQQYLIGQNRPGLLDAGIALMSYPDMVTQTVRIMDCELLEYYFDVVDADNAKWSTWSNRRWIEGFNAIDGGEADPVVQMTALSQLRNGRWPTLRTGQTECTKSWRTLTPLVVNPHHVHFRSLYSDDVAERVPWTYWDNLKRVFGTDEAGYARRTWDNVGVQYGLQALKQEKISIAEFIRLNENVGGWKPAGDMQPERYWLFPPARSRLADFSRWSHHNMFLKGDDGKPARRSRGDLEAIAAAYRAGQVFVGHLSMPLVDLRYYLEPDLDMHHTLESFAARLRMLDGQGHAGNQLIWVARPPAMPIGDAFDILERWLRNLQEQPADGVLAAKPALASDRCYDEWGEVVASGDDVWDGAWNGRRDGDCMQRYPIFSNPRIVAGDNYAGDIFKCHLQSVDDAIASGVYQPVDVSGARNAFRRVFPDGVCDYALGDVGRPADLFGIDDSQSAD